MPQSFPLVVVGGNGLVGPYLLKQLVLQGFVADVISRYPLPIPEGFTMTAMDLTSSRNWIAPAGSVVISLLPLWVLAQFLPRFMGVKAIIATCSTNRYSKLNSSDLRERSVAANLELSEEALARWAERSNVTWTLLRSTMVYDCLNDKNITRMARFINRWHALPIAPPASGLRQPIHADDVANAIVNCITNPNVANRDLTIAGGEAISYRVMAERIFTALKLKPRFISLPATLLQKMFVVGSRLGLIHETTFGSMIFQRMNEDFVFDASESLDRLNTQPRPFTPEFPGLIASK